MQYTIYSLALCLIAHTTFFAADAPIKDTVENSSKEAELILQRLATELNQIATTDYNNGINILQTLTAVARHHTPGCTHHTVTIMGNEKSFDFIKDTLGKPANKYQFVETSLNKATEQFLKLKEKNSAAYTSQSTVFWTALVGTKTMIECILSIKEIDNSTRKNMLPLACIYGNVEVTEYLTQKLAITDMPHEKIPSILDLLNGEQTFIKAEAQQELTMFKNAATIRLEYMNHKNPDTQKIRKTCPFEECQRLVTEAINRQKTTDAHNEATTNLTTAASMPLQSTTVDDQLSNNQSDNSAQKS